jgi:hypothetical protein
VEQLQASYFPDYGGSYMGNTTLIHQLKSLVDLQHARFSFDQSLKVRDLLGVADLLELNNPIDRSDEITATYIATGG